MVSVSPRRPDTVIVYSQLCLTCLGPASSLPLLVSSAQYYGGQEPEAEADSWSKVTRPLVEAGPDSGDLGGLITASIVASHQPPSAATVSPSPGEARIL